MCSLLLIFIFVTFVSLGLPINVLGSVWPSMQPQLQVPLSYAGILTMILQVSQAVAGFWTDRLIRRFGTGLITAVTVAVIACSMLGFSLFPHFWLLCLFSIPFGLASGFLDVTLNNYVALHYESRHMNWLHCFWSLGSTLGPWIMSLCLTNHLRWNSGYLILAILLGLWAAVLFLALPLWKKQPDSPSETRHAPAMTLLQILKTPGLFQVLLAFFSYSSIEIAAGLWAPTYLVNFRGYAAAAAASGTTMFFLGGTCGRFLGGFIADRLGDRNMIRLGLSLAVLSLFLLLFTSGPLLPLAALFLLGMGGGPVIPCLIHQTPDNFGPEKAQGIIGVQMAFTFTGGALMPYLFGLLAQYISLRFYPLFLLCFVLLMIVSLESVNRRKRLGKI